MNTLKRKKTIHVRNVLIIAKFVRMKLNVKNAKILTNYMNLINNVMKIVHQKPSNKVNLA